jgi:hypothetical protein
MSDLTDPEEFVHCHRALRVCHRRCDGTRLERLSRHRGVPCGVVPERWVTPLDTELDLHHVCLLK